MCQRFRTIRFIVIIGAFICLPNDVWVRFFSVMEIETSQFSNYNVKELYASVFLRCVIGGSPFIVYSFDSFVRT